MAFEGIPDNVTDEFLEDAIIAAQGERNRALNACRKSFDNPTEKLAYAQEAVAIGMYIDDCRRILRDRRAQKGLQLIDQS
tara:strand:- start:190 stop:429 length:240 start_codon:yes stop_codon:yes gene_type:complete